MEIKREEKLLGLGVKKERLDWKSFDNIETRKREKIEKKS
jgi:hypothetical protein